MPRNHFAIWDDKNAAVASLRETRSTLASSHGNTRQIAWIDREIKTIEEEWTAAASDDDREAVVGVARAAANTARSLTSPAPELQPAATPSLPSVPSLPSSPALKSQRRRKRRWWMR